MRRLTLITLMALATQAQAEDWLYLTYPGDTLSQIGVKYLMNGKDWTKIQAINKVPNPKSLPKNTRIRIPVELLKVTPAPATVSHVKGNVRVQGADQRYRKLEQGAQVNGGETIITGPHSFASVRLADGSTVSQQPSTRLTFGRLAAYGETGMVSTEMQLDGGRIEARAAKQVAPAGGMRVRTPVAVAGLRGTEFRLNVAEDGKRMAGEVLEGGIALAAAGQEVGLGANQGSYAEAGKPPAPPRPLLPPPTATDLPAKVMQLPLQFAWTNDPAATGWRAQVAANQAFQEILLDDAFTQPKAVWDESLPDGHYVLRLRGVDSVGLEGRNLDHPFELDARPLPPPLAAPTEGQRSYQNTVNLAWAGTEEAHGYLLQLSSKADFAAPEVERRLAAVTRHGENLARGTWHWHWRMASLDEQGKARLWGEVRSFRVQPLPEAPKGGEARADNGQAHLAWQAVAGAERYELALGNSRDLGKPAVSQKIPATRIALPLQPGEYFWRVRGLEADGQAGDWSGVSAVVMPPPPPVPPGDLTAAMEGDVLVASWRGSTPYYRLEIAKDSGFAEITLSHWATEPASRILRPEDGAYWVRVIGLDANGKETGVSQATTLSVKRSFGWLNWFK